MKKSNSPAAINVTVHIDGSPHVKVNLAEIEGVWLHVRGDSYSYEGVSIWVPELDCLGAIADAIHRAKMDRDALAIQASSPTPP